MAESFDYAEYLALAKEHIAECGCSMTYIKRRESGKVDARTGKRTVTESKSEFEGLITKPLATEVQAGRFQKAQMVILAAGDVTDKPDITDCILCNGREYAISEIVPVMPGGVPVLYKFGVNVAGTALDA